MAKNNPKKIALVYDAVFPFIKGGAQKRFYEIGRRLAREGFDVHIYGMKCWKGPNIINRDGMTIHGISKNYPLYTKSGRRSILQALMFGLASVRLWRESFNIIDCCGFPYFSIFPVRLITWTKRKPLYSTWHEVWGYDYWKEYLGAFGIFGYVVEKLAAKMPDTIISVSDSTTEALKEKLGRKKNVITAVNGLDLEIIRKTSPAIQSSDIIFAGRLVEYKNVDLLILAISIIAKTNPKISAFIIGEGPERKKLESLVRELNLSQNVKFLGFLEDETVYAYMRSSKVLVLPSVREGFGMVVLEANACGLPVITVNHPQNAAQDLIIDEANGKIVPLGAASLAEEILHQLQKEKNLIDYSSYSNSYDWSIIAAKIKNIYLNQ